MACNPLKTFCDELQDDDDDYDDDEVTYNSESEVDVEDERVFDVTAEEIDNMPICVMDGDGSIYPVEQHPTQCDDQLISTRQREPQPFPTLCIEPLISTSTPEKRQRPPSCSPSAKEDRQPETSKRARGGESPGKRGQGSSPRAETTRGRGSGSRANIALVGDRGVPGDRKMNVTDVGDMPPLVTNIEEARNQRHVSLDDDESQDESQDAESNIACEFFEGDTNALEFEWSSMSTFNGQAEEFLQTPGPTWKVSCAYDAFRKIWDDDILEHIVTETNRYAAELKKSSAHFATQWFDTNVHEILILFAFWMMLGIIRMPSIKSCFSNNSLLKTNIFRKLLPESRFWNLNRALHFVDNSTRKPNSSKLFFLGPVAEHLNANFKKCYIPDQNITIDESLTLWKGNLSFSQYNKTKAARFGIKTFELCESSTGYLWSFVIYTGENPDTSLKSVPQTMRLVITLILPLLNYGYKLFMDNYFNSPLLARYLKRNKTDCIGILRPNRKYVPAIIQTATLPQGTCLARHSGDVVVLAYQDKKLVHMITTCHGEDSVLFEGKSTKPAHHKLAVIGDYNRNMGGVDKKDQMLEPFLLERKKNKKWYNKFFKRLLNVSINNSRILVDRCSENPKNHQDYRLKLVDAIMTNHLTEVPHFSLRHYQGHSNRNAELPVDRFISGNHFIIRIVKPGNQPRSNKTNRNSRGCSNCMWCSVREKRRSSTVYKCKKCDVPLCIDCFEKFHTVR